MVIYGQMIQYLGLLVLGTSKFTSTSLGSMCYVRIGILALYYHPHPEKIYTLNKNNSGLWMVALTHIANGKAQCQHE